MIQLPSDFILTCGIFISDNTKNFRFVTYDNGSVPLDAKGGVVTANKISAEKIGVIVNLEAY